jgi:hypothetical protein
VVPEPAAFVAVHCADDVAELVEYGLRGFAPIHFTFAVNDRRRKERRLVIRRRRRVSVARRTLWASVARAFGDVGHGVGLLCASRPDLELWHG